MLAADFDPSRNLLLYAIVLWRVWRERIPQPLGALLVVFEVSDDICFLVVSIAVAGRLA